MARSGGADDALRAGGSPRAGRLQASFTISTRGGAGGSIRFLLDEWPETRLVHVAFQVMVGAGSALALVALWWGAAWWHRRSAGRSMPYPNEDRTLLWAVALTGPLGFLALEAGWTVTEVGRQPWIV